MAIISKKQKEDRKQKAREAHAKRKDKRKNYEFQKKYGITLEQFDAMRVEQQHSCYLCGTHEIFSTKGILVVDHNHKTGEVRRLLCGCCNVGIGMLQDNPNLLRTAAKYLELYGYSNQD